MDEIKNLGSQIKRISKRRNDAAHASRISYYTAKQDKEIIFDETIEVDDVKNMRNLLMNTLHIFIVKR